MTKQYQKYINFMEKYRDAPNASSGSEVDANANVENKNVATMTGELFKLDTIKINRLLMHNKLKEMYSKELADEYIRQIESHEIYKHDESSIMPYCVSITMYPFLFDGLTTIGGISDAPKHLNSFAGAFINLVFAIASQFAGAVSTPEFLTYMDYFVRKEYGDDYYKYASPTTSDDYVYVKKKISDVFSQVVYSLNQPAAARNFQSVFWNIAYFDSNYFEGIFKDFVFPDGTKPQWESVSWLQKYFMNWFNKERLRKVITFPVETVNLLDNGKEYVDKEWADFTAEMYAKGHSFFTYRSDSVDSLASCCFDGSQTTLTKSSQGVNYMSFRDIYNAKHADFKRNFTIMHNGSWCKGSVVRLPAKPMYKITTSNKKHITVTEDHINPTQRGNVSTKNLTTEDYLLFNTRALDCGRANASALKYEEGFLIGMYLGDGSIYDRKNCNSSTMNLSLNAKKIDLSRGIIDKALENLNITANVCEQTPRNNAHPLTITSIELCDYIRHWAHGDYCYDKKLNLDCLLESREFRTGILDGLYLTDGGNSNRIYSTSLELINTIEALITSLGTTSVVDIFDRTDEKVVIRGKSYNRNHPLYCIRWYGDTNKRSMGDVYIVNNNSIYFKITSIEPFEPTDEYCYCFEMENENEPYFTLPNGIITHNCRLRNDIVENTFSFTLGAGGVSTGSKGVITTNINRLVQNATRGGVDISSAIREQAEKNIKYLTAFNEIVLDNFKGKMLPVYDAGYISLQKQYLTQGINGFVEGAEFLGIEISPNDRYFEYGESILKPIYETNKKAKTKDLMFNTEFVPAENLGVKNAKWDKKDGYSVPRDCYNSYFYVVEDDSSNIIDKFILHGEKLTRYLDGGSALHANLDEHLSKRQYQDLLNVAIKTGCSYLTFNIPNTICNKCGFISKQRLYECSKCGSQDLDYITRIIGYLKRISAFSTDRQKEAHERYYEKTT